MRKQHVGREAFSAGRSQGRRLALAALEAVRRRWRGFCADEPAACRAVADPLEPRIVLSGPYISEFMAVNGGTLADEDAEYSDWIEIHNPAGTAVNLDGW